MDGECIMMMKMRAKSRSQIQQLIDAAPREKDIDIYIYTNTVSRTNYIKKQNI